MLFRAVGNRCAVALDTLGLPIDSEEAFKILSDAGIASLPVDVVKIARDLVGAEYRRGARLREAPEIFDCSSFTKYLYGRLGIWLPRRSIQQRMCGTAVDLDELRAGDLVFCSGRIDYFDTDPSDGVGHVGVATGEGTILHAANPKSGVVEDGVLSFLDDPDGFRGVRRVMPADAKIVTLLNLTDRDVETSDDIRWIVLQNL